MPVYNTERFVGEAVESVLSQTYKSFEFIIIDDGSMDGSLAILRKYAQDDQRIRLVSRPNTGYAVAINEGIDLAQGELLARIDSDDVIEATLFDRQVLRFHQNPRLVALGACAMIMDEFGEVFGQFDVPEDPDEIEGFHLSGVSAVHHPGVMIRMDTVRQVGSYRPEMSPCEDLDLWLRLGEHGVIANLPQRFIKKRMLETGAVVSGVQKHEELIEQIVADALRRRGIQPSGPPKHSQIRNQVDFLRQWAWLALRGGKTTIAWRYAWRALRLQLMNASTWKLIACIIRGR